MFRIRNLKELFQVSIDGESVILAITSLKKITIVTGGWSCTICDAEYGAYLHGAANWPFTDMFYCDKWACCYRNSIGSEEHQNRIRSVEVLEYRTGAARELLGNPLKAAFCHLSTAAVGSEHLTGSSELRGASA